jgi:UDP-3-O-[3-hydroxymyristoyl] glucosamine N-acyltransferase
MAMTLGELAERIGAVLEPGSAAKVQVDGCATLAGAGPRQVAFLTNPRYGDQLATTQAAAIITAPATPTAGKVRLVADDAYFAFRKAMVALHGRPSPTPGVHASASVDDAARIGAGTSVGPGCVIEANVVIGRDCAIGPNVVVYRDCILGDRITLHAGCVIGVDGYGYATHGGAHHKIPPAGNVVIEADVEMGANCVIERATLGSTVIGEGTKFADAVVIGHGSRVGRHNLFVAQVGLAGSVVTGDYVAIGGQSGIAGHLTIGDRAQVAAHSGVMTDVPPDTRYGGTPAQPLGDAKRSIVAAQRLPELFERVRKLERKE